MSNVTLQQAFLKAFALVNNPDTWTKEAFARDKWREPVGIFTKDAVCWCATGACYLTAEEKAKSLVDLLHKKASALYDGHNLININDWIGREAVVNVFQQVGEERGWLSKCRALVVKEAV